MRWHRQVIRGRWTYPARQPGRPPLVLQGIVEDVSLRRTKLRTLDVEAIHIHNSQIPAVRVLRRG